MASVKDLNVSPEILFLIKEHAKTVASLKSISRRLQDLERKVDNIHQLVKERKCPCPPSSGAAETNKSTTTKGDTPQTHVLSDDSGGEYSRTTTGTTADEDELLSLLDQIAKCSHQIHNTQQGQQYQSQLLYGSLCSRQCPQSSSNSMPGLYSSSTTNNSNLQKQQSLTALLFDPNVERFLKNIEDI